MTAVDTAPQTQSVPAPAELTPRDRVRVAVASTIGTTIEFYDFYIYATAAVAVVRDSVCTHESTGPNTFEQVH